MKTLALVAVVVAAIATLVAFAERAQVAPRRLAAYVERRAWGHRPLIVRTGRTIAHWLEAVDRGEPARYRPLPVPAVAERAAPVPARVVAVASAEDARRAIDEAEPGDEIVFAPGTYRFEGQEIAVRPAGAPGKPIVVRAGVPGATILEFALVEGFHVSAPYWTFEDLEIRGVCAAHDDCEHAFHVVGGATHFVARGNRIVDFNAHFKVNGAGGAYPDDGLIEGNVLANDSVRETGDPVTPIDLVAASRWRIAGNRIRDFVKAGANRVSYGVFVKGGGRDNRIERNVVVCEDRLRNQPGARVGVSLGGGGTAPESCRGGRCITEQERGVVASNLIASCSDDGIYLNRAAISTISQNTLLDTAGISARGGQSSADLDGNLVDGVVRAVDGARLHGDDNVTTAAASLFVGRHPVRSLFADAAALDLPWRTSPPRRNMATHARTDLCGRLRPAGAVYGAFEDISACGSAAAPRIRATSADVERR